MIKLFKMKNYLFVLLLVLICSVVKGQTVKTIIPPQDTSSVKEVVYKTIGDVNLKLIMYYPSGVKSKKPLPAIVFFFGGGFINGSPTQFRPHAAYLASRGMIAITAEYRVESRHKTTPFDAVADAKSAIRYVRIHAKELGVDPGRIAAGGGSAGGHLAAAAGNLPGLDEKSEDLSVSSKPNALVLYNPVFDNGPEGYGYDRAGDRYREISPIHNISKGAPPTIVFLGTKDALVPVATAEKYKMLMENIGSRCDLMLYEGQAHGFFNSGKGNNRYFLETLYESDKFLTSLGYLKGRPTFEINKTPGLNK